MTVSWSRSFLALVGCPTFAIATWWTAAAYPSVRQIGIRITGAVHEARPTEDRVLSGVRIEVAGGELDGRVFTTGTDGTFSLPEVQSAGFALAFNKDGYDSSRLILKAVPPGGKLDVPMMPTRATIMLSRSGANDCDDLPTPPLGVPGLREYARLAVHHDGELLVNSARAPFFSNEGYVYRLTSQGWVKNEFDYILIRSAVPVRGGFLYVVTFGGDKDLCGPWSIDATHPN
jgi:hypothetical protein